MVDVYTGVLERGPDARLGDSVLAILTERGLSLHPDLGVIAHPNRA